MWQREYGVGTTSLRLWKVLHMGQQKETLLMTYKAVGRSIINYAAPVWSPNLHDTNYRKFQYSQNEALRIATGCHMMSSIDHLHTEAEMLKVRNTQSYCLHSTWPDAWNQEMYVTPSQQGLPLKTDGDPGMSLNCAPTRVCRKSASKPGML